MAKNIHPPRGNRQDWYSGLMDTEESFGIIPYVEDDQGKSFLLIQHLAGHWGFPKGHANKDEDARSAACREFEEETGIRTYRLLDLPPISESYPIEKQGSKIHKTVLYYIAECQERQIEIQEDEIKDYCWLAAESSYEKLTFPESRKLFKNALSLLEK